MNRQPVRHRAARAVLGGVRGQVNLSGPPGITGSGSRMGGNPVQFPYNTNPNFLVNTNGWIGFDGTLAWTNSLPGSAPAAQGAQFQITTAGGAIEGSPASFVITYGQVITVSAWVYCASTISVSLGCDFLNASGGYITTITSTFSVPATTWTFCTTKITAALNNQAGAQLGQGRLGKAYARIGTQTLTTIYVTNLQVMPGNGSIAVADGTGITQRDPRQRHRAQVGSNLQCGAGKVRGAFYNGTVQPRSTVRLPRRYPARVTWHKIIGRSFPNGRTQPRATIAIARRAHTRVTWHRVIGALNAHGPLGAVQALSTRLPRRRPARANIRSVLGTANLHGPSGTVPPHRVVARRTSARGVTRHGYGPSNAHGAKGTARPKGSVLAPRRIPARVVTRHVVGVSNQHGPAGTLQPRATIPVPRRKSTRVLWKGIKPIQRLEESAIVVIGFDVQQMLSASVVVSFGVAAPGFNIQNLPPQSFLQMPGW